MQQLEEGCLFLFDGRETQVMAENRRADFECAGRITMSGEPRINKGCDLYTKGQKPLPLSLVGRMRSKYRDGNMSG